jgi:hypothetical protein
MKTRIAFYGVFFLLTEVMLAVPKPVLSFADMDADTSGYFTLYGQNKLLPKGFEKHALIALSYFPELKNTRIEFVVNDDVVPLTTMPTIWSVFRKPDNRLYKIIISQKSNEMLTPILLKNLSYDAQVGVLSHELSHVSDFQTWNFFHFIRHVCGHLSSRYVDRFEYNTDLICITHGLGYQLKAWSIDTRKKLDIKAFFSNSDIKEGRERYMNPDTIDRYILKDKNYQTEPIKN